MKRKLILFLVLCMCFLVGCGNEHGNLSESGTKNDDFIGETEKVDESDLLSQMDIEEYSYENGVGDTIYILVLKNNSKDTVKVFVNAIAKDASGNIIGAADSEENGIGSGEIICLVNYFDSVEDASDFEYTMTVKQDRECKSVLSELEIRESQTSEKVIVTCTNNGDNTPFVKISALFFNDGKLIGYDYGFVVDDESELKPGVTLSEELTYDEEFDEVQVFVRAK